VFSLVLDGAVFSKQLTLGKLKGGGVPMGSSDTMSAPLVAGVGEATALPIGSPKALTKVAAKSAKSPFKVRPGLTAL
jgi:hypothetical protein